MEQWKHGQIYELYTSSLHFTFGINKMHATPHAFDILVAFPGSLYKSMLFKFQVKDAVGIIDHAQNT